MNRKIRVLIVVDSFKGSVSSFQAGLSLKEGFGSQKFDVEIIPAADGGEGTAEAFVKLLNGEYVTVVVHNPLGKKINAQYGLIDAGRTAVIEMAAASGITLLSDSELNPMLASTYGTGELISDALSKNVEKIIFGIGGSATNDCGIGMAAALGIKFYDENGKPAGIAAKDLPNVHSIDFSGINPLIKNTEIITLCDVKNPLTGKNGAAYVYGKQKGAGEAAIKLLDNYISRFADLTENLLGGKFAELPGAGAAGGLGFAAMAFLNSRLTGGSKFIADYFNIEEKIVNADLVITGEGKIDEQTKYDKLPASIARIAKKHNKTVYAVCGIADDSGMKLKGELFDKIFVTGRLSKSRRDSIENAGKYLKRIASDIRGEF